MNNKMKKVMILSIAIMLSAVVNTQAQTTMELLTSNNWEPQNYFDEEEGERGYIKFTATTRTYVEDIDGEIDRAPNEFYLSNSIEYTFDNSKVGKNSAGRYIIRNGAGYVFIAEIIELTSEKLVTQNLTPNFTSTGHITTHLPTTLNF